MAKRRTASRARSAYEDDDERKRSVDVDDDDRDDADDEADEPDTGDGEEEADEPADEDRDDEDEDDWDDEDEEEDKSPPAGRSRNRSRGLNAARAAVAGIRALGQLISKEPQGVTSVEPADGGWRVEVEVLEDARIPSSADILATYEVHLDERGDLMSYRRGQRYQRGKGEG